MGKSSGQTSVVIVNYNSSRHAFVLMNLLAKEPLAKVVVVDNASTDHRPEILTDDFPNSFLIKNATNVGYGEACNIGMRWVFENTDSANVLVLNPDTIVLPGMIEKLEHSMSDGIEIVTPRITMYPETNLLWYGGGYYSKLKGSARIPGYGKNAEAPLAIKERDVNFASGCAMLISRKAFMDAGGFDPDYFMYEEDVEFSLRVISKGFRIHYVPDAVIHHSRQGSQPGEVPLPMFHRKNPNLSFYVYYSVRNRFYTVFKHGNFFERILFVIGIILWTVYKGIDWLAGLRFDAFGAVLRGVFDFLRGKMGARS